MGAYQAGRLILFLLALAAIIVMPGCELAGGIFKAGFWVGIVIAALAIGLVFAMVRRTRG